jgi:tRNA (guanine-N7-)-methyltransferase
MFMDTLPIKTFSRRISRSLRDGQKQLLDEFFPTVKIDADTDFFKLRESYESIVLEIGFGNGDFTAQVARANEANLYIGAEPFLNGVASLLKKMQDASIKNIKIFPDDVRILLAAMPRKYLDKIFIICPDPWPKKRHHKRRLVQASLLNELSAYLKATGEIEIITDHAGYAEWIADEIAKCPSLELDVHQTGVELSEGWMGTKYQRRGVALGSSIHRFVLNNRSM